ncbi:ATP-binding protein [Streptacidiphilus sp. EB129]|uniref:ATP-binding protein n=1 Tax=Streptacidiphilus sp. EB129 TaxID=3156262 RepID=UPI0035110BFD
MESDRHYELCLTAEPQRFTVVRRIVTAHLRHWNLPDLVDQALLGVTELLGNVHRHVGPLAECRLRLTAVDGFLRCEVHDSSPTLPRLLAPPEDEPTGRGLALVAALSKEWGAQPEESGKVVWFALQSSEMPAEPYPDEPGSGPGTAAEAEAAVEVDHANGIAASEPLRLATLPSEWRTPPPPPEKADERGRIPVRVRV